MTSKFKSAESDLVSWERKAKIFPERILFQLILISLKRVEKLIGTIINSLRLACTENIEEALTGINAEKRKIHH